MYRLLHIHIYFIQTRLTSSSFILLMNISGRTSIFYKRILFLTINYVNALSNHFNSPNLTASQILGYIYIYTRVSDFHSTYKQCSMPKQSYYLGETIQHELKCATIGFVFITIIRHIKSLQEKSKCIIHQLNGYYNSLFNANNLTLTVEKLQSIVLNSA